MAIDMEALKKKKDEEVQMKGAIRPNPTYCNTCINANGKPPYADKPNKANCKVYSSEFKPRGVLFNGAECKYYKER